MLKALQEAAASDDAARARLAQYDEDRRNVIAAGLALILGRTAPDELVDAMWALVSPEVFIMLTQRRNWSIARTEEWLVQATSAADRYGATLTYSRPEPDEPARPPAVCSGQLLEALREPTP